MVAETTGREEASVVVAAFLLRPRRLRETLVPPEGRATRTPPSHRRPLVGVNGEPLQPPETGVKLEGGPEADARPVTGEAETDVVVPDALALHRVAAGRGGPLAVA